MSEGGVGYSCIAEIRMIETIETGAPKTSFMKFGDRVRNSFDAQVRKALNPALVREGERVMIDGIPWRVDAIGVFSKLRNPLLAGGEMRLPIRSLPNLKSRMSPLILHCALQFDFG